MKRFMILCLVSAIGAVATIDKASAQNAPGPGFCLAHPQAPICHVPPPGPGGNPPQHGDWQHRRMGWHRSFDPIFPVFPAPVVNRCDAIARSLWQEGYHRIQKQKCVGRIYVYTAERDGDAVQLFVQSGTGRIIRVRPAY